LTAANSNSAENSSPYLTATPEAVQHLLTKPNVPIATVGPNLFVFAIAEVKPATKKSSSQFATSIVKLTANASTTRLSADLKSSSSMNSLIENSQQKLWPAKCRRGMSSIEFAVIIALIVVFLIGTVFVLGESTRDLFSSTAQKLDFGAAKQVQQTVASPAPVVQANAPDVKFHFQLLAIAGAICVSFFGYRYITFAKAAENTDSTADPSENAIQIEPDVLQKILAKRTSIYNRMQDDLVALFEGNSKVGTYMSTQLKTVRPDLAVDQCYALLEEQGYRRFMVTNEDGHMLGVISKRDLQMKIGNVVSDVMTDTPKVVPSNTCLSVGLSMLIQSRIACLPIVDNEILVGVLTRSDILVVLQCVLTTLKGTFEEHNARQKSTPAPAPIVAPVPASTPMPAN
jgi:CBS domain-containing protein/Flp pilus assembly pilin Flp